MRGIEVDSDVVNEEGLTCIAFSTDQNTAGESVFIPCNGFLHQVDLFLPVHPEFRFEVVLLQEKLAVIKWQPV